MHRVLITRAREDAERTAAAVRELGLQPVCVPLLERVIHDRALPDALADGWRADLAVLTSPTAARALRRAVRRGLAPPAEIAVVGQATAKAAGEIAPLRQLPRRSTAAELIASLQLGPGQRVLYPRPEVTTRGSLEALQATGAELRDVVVYTNREPAGATDALKRSWPLDVAPLLSASAARRLAAALQRANLPAPDLLAIGPSTAAAALQLGLRVDRIASPHSLQGILAALRSWAKERPDTTDEQRGGSVTRIAAQPTTADTPGPWDAIDTVVRQLNDPRVSTRRALAEALEVIADLTCGARACLLVDPEQLSLITEEQAGTVEASLGRRARVSHRGPARLAMEQVAGQGPVVRGRFTLFPEAGVAIEYALPEEVQRHGAPLRIVLQLLHSVIGRAQLRREVLVLQEEIEDQQARFERQASFLRNLSVIDSLTRLHNRRYFDQQLAFAVAEHERYGTSFALLILDLDDFKQVNDTFGHFAGDCALRAVAWTLAETVRGADRVARIGGEEFALLLPSSKVDGAICAAERICEAIAAATVHTGRYQFGLTVSIGVAHAGAGWAGDPASLFRRADAGLYRAKRLGKNRAELAPTPLEES